MMKKNDKDRYVSIPEIRDILMEDSKNEGFSHDKREMMHHAEAFSFQSLEDTLKLIDELQKIDRVNSYHAHKLAEILPQTEEELKAVFAKEIMSPTEEEMKNILDTIKKFV